MATAKSDIDLVVAAAELSVLSPHSWMTFMRELQGYVDRGKDAMLSSGPDTLPLAQGRAVERQSFYSLLASCKEEREKLKR